MSPEALIEEIEMALLANDGGALERAWYDLYGIDPARAISVAKVLRPLSAQRVDRSSDPLPRSCGSTPQVVMA